MTENRRGEGEIIDVNLKPLLFICKGTHKHSPWIMFTILINFLRIMLHLLFLCVSKSASYFSLSYLVNFCIMLENQESLDLNIEKYFEFLLKRAYSLKGTADENHRLQNRQKWHQIYTIPRKSAAKISCHLDNLHQHTIFQIISNPTNLCLPIYIKR